MNCNKNQTTYILLASLLHHDILICKVKRLNAVAQAPPSCQGWSF